jgi:hypothetical protein
MAWENWGRKAGSQNAAGQAQQLVICMLLFSALALGSAAWEYVGRWMHGSHRLAFLRVGSSEHG